MVSSPTAVHESVLVAMNRSLTWTLVTIPVPVQTLLCTVMANNYFEGDLIHAIPDLTIKLHCDQVGQEIWLMESAFSQTDESVMKKLWGYVRDIPGLLVVGKILFQESAQYRRPGVNAAKNLQSSELMTQDEFTSCSHEDEGFVRVVVDNHTWFELASVELHVWVRQAGKPAIDLDCLELCIWGVLLCFGYTNR